MLEKDREYLQEIIKGNKFYNNGIFRKALYHYLKAKRLRPDDFAANMNCANANFMIKKYNKTIYYINKLKLNYKDDVKLILLAAKACFEAEQYEKAKEYFEKIIVFGSKNPWNYNYLSQCWQKLKNYDKAFDIAWKAIKLAGGDDTPHQLNFGYLLYEVKIENNKYDTSKWAEKWLEKYPDNPLVQYMGNAAIGGKVDKNCLLPGIRSIFDAFAPEFEETLADLEYKTPEKIFAVLRNYDLAKTSVLDLGCGTGLCGKYLRHFARLGRLYGVDISAKMLGYAAQKRIYNKLYCNDIVSFLKKTDKSFGIVAAADVLTYFRDLAEVFSLVYKVLDNNGIFVFSVTKSPNGEAFFLHPSGRYEHSLKYVNKTAEKCGFSMDYFEECELRTENNQPVKGYICLLKKAS